MMIAALQAAGFPGVEPEGDVIFARLSASGAEFRAEPAGDLWKLALHWPVRLDAAALAVWNADHPEAMLDIFKGETRLQMRLPATPGALSRWNAAAEAMIAVCIAFRRGQRARGEGM